MADAKVFELSVKSFTADKLEIKVKNTSGKALTSPLSMEFYAPAFLVNDKINAAAKAAATSLKPIGAASLAGVVSGPESWSVWARRETSDTSVIIALFNDVDRSGDVIETPIAVAAGAEFIISIPLDPQAERTDLTLVYSYQHGDDRIDDKLQLKSDKVIDWAPDVRLTTNHASPTAIEDGSLVKIFWRVKDGVSGKLFGPLPGGNAELPLESRPEADFKISAGSLELRVVSSATYILQAQVKGPGKDNVEIVRMLSLDTKNRNYTFLSPRPGLVLPYGLIEIDWAAWGVKQVMISVSGHNTRTIPLTQQTLGRFYEGSGVMRITARKVVNKETATIEQISLNAPGLPSKSETVTVVPWMPNTTPEIAGEPVGLAVIAPRIALLTTHALYVADVGHVDGSSFSAELDFTLKASPTGSSMFRALAAVDQRFVCVRMTMSKTAEVELAPFTSDGEADKIPPVTLPPEVQPLAFAQGAVIDFVGFWGRAYFVVETPKPLGTARRAWSVGFDSTTKKADLRSEPLLEPLIGYRLVSFDKGLYALNRDSGEMFRFDLTKTGTLETPKKAASAVKKVEGAQDESMVKDGLLTPVGRLLVVLSPTSVPAVSSLERYGLQNTLRHSSSNSAPTSPSNIPQDLVYNPQKDYWARCGHDLDVKANAKAAFRGGQSMRLWVVHPDNQIDTLAAGDETLFAPDFVFEFPTKPLSDYLNKTREFKITNNTGLHLQPLSETLRNAGLADFSVNRPAELISPPLEEFRNGATQTVEFGYNEADPAPINLRFQVRNTTGFQHDYVLELTFSGPDLSTATSVFKRVKVESSGRRSIAEIPDTKVQHSTNAAVVIPPPKRLIEGVKLRAQNLTTYQLWRETPEAKDRNEVLKRYSGDEIKITYETPAFFLSAYGAGQLDINVDFALPLGVEISPSNQPQLKLVRITTDKTTGLRAEIDPTTSQTSFVSKISYLLKREVDAVYIGDGVATTKGDAIYLPVAHSSDQRIPLVWKINLENLATSATTIPTQILSSGAFSSPNSIVLCNEFIFAMFGDTDLHVIDSSMQIKAKVNLADAYTVVTGIRSPNELTLLLGFKDKGSTQNPRFSHALGTKLINDRSGQFKVSPIREVSLDAVQGFRAENKMTGYPAWVSSKTLSPMALSPSNFSNDGEFVWQAAICIDGGLITVGSSERVTRTLALNAAGREEAVVFGAEGKHIYCLHSESDEMGLRLTRVDNKAWKQTHSLQLQTGQKAPDLASDTRQQRPPGTYKNQRSISMVRTLDDKLIFVSHGTTIFKVDAATMKLLDTYKTELPCRVFHVWHGKPTEASHAVYGTPSSCILLYAIGATYKGNGINATEFKTQFYKLAIPD